VLWPEADIAACMVKSRNWLRWLATGTLLGTFAWLLPWAFFTMTKPETFYVLAYSRNSGPVVWPEVGVSDPAPGLHNVSEYPVQIAIRCNISPWKISTNLGTTDVDKTSWVRIRSDVVDDRAFNCLSQFVRPPYVRLERGTEAELRSRGQFGE